MSPFDSLIFSVCLCFSSINFPCFKAPKPCRILEYFDGQTPGEGGLSSKEGVRTVVTHESFPVLNIP